MQKNKKGVTLVELICALAITGFLIVTLGTCISVAGRQYAMVLERTRAKSAVTNISYMMQASLSTAKSATLQNDSSSVSGREIWFGQSDGFLYTNPSGALLYSKEYYNGYNIEFKFKKASDGAVIIIASARNSNGQVIYNGQTTASLLNVKIENINDKVKTDGGENEEYSAISIKY